MAYKILYEKITEEGYLAKIVKNDSHLCGYIGITDKHPLYQLEYNNHSDYLRKSMARRLISDEEFIGSPMDLLCFNNEVYSPVSCFNIHGGITYSRNGEKVLTKRTDRWFFGFDCNHCDDLTHPKDEEFVKYQCEKLSKLLKMVEEDIKEER